MLDLETIDLEELCMALDDQDYETSWWLHPESGEIRHHAPAVEELTGESVDDLEEGGFVPIESTGSREGYRDMQAFITMVPDPRAADLLDRAIEGKGAFRRFKDTLVEFPELREQWFAFRDDRMWRRAVQWLADEGIVDQEAARKALAERAEPESLSAATSPWRRPT